MLLVLRPTLPTNAGYATNGETLLELCAREVITVAWTQPGHYVASLEIVPAVLFVESPRLFASAESKVRLQSTIALR